ncbi:ABC transporter substrate-binding protein [Phyllobacterium sophorae]|uniref:Oligopeptide ABC transporter substrate-binding protein n=1 Tax=Phyllobacterium sophorae TaxID=1520277 RepID=A0A2P7AQI7_9HYPH|nr:ABC transporter substrate-binding protein [Phyllobacterium sophorae]PSH56481.1 oligopeptide ABC transporter substrate-binding protein [Phyllobacterium sophorae]
MSKGVKRRTLLRALAASTMMAASFSLGALDAAAQSTTAGGRNLTIAVQQIPDNHDPVSENTNVNLRVMYSLYDTLVKVDFRNGNKLVPGLATEWKVIDAKTVEFKLRPNVVFHNGDTFDAKDVVATFSPVRLGLDKTVPVESRPFLSGIDRVEVVDNMTVRFQMKTGDAIILSRFAYYPSQIISATALKEAKSYQDFTAMDAGTGPYSLVSHEVGKDVVLKKFDKYWGNPKAAADTVTFTAVPELATRVAGLLSGQFDIITEIGTDEVAQIEANSATGVAGGPVANIRGLFYDCISSPISDPRIRRALNFSIDRETLVLTLYNGRVGIPHDWQMASFGDLYLADRPAAEYNPEKARALLKEAGYNGEEIVYRTLPTYYAKQLETAQILQSMWKAVGFNIKLEVKENWDQATKDTPDRAIIDSSFTGYYSDPLGQFWRRFGPESSYTKQGWWTISPEMQKLGDELTTSTDIKRRREVFGKMLDEFEQDPHGGMLHDLAQFMGVRKDRIELKPLPSEYLDLTTEGVSFK